MNKTSTLLKLIILSLGLLPTTTSAQQLELAIGMPVANALNFFYDHSTGNFTAATNGVNSAGAPLLITTFELKSASGKFHIDGLCPTFGPGDPFAVKTPEKLFTLNTAGLSDICLGTVLGPGLSSAEIIEDLTISGSIKPGGSLAAAPGGGPYLIWLPEPSGLLLAAVGLLGLLRLRRVR